MYRFSNSKGIVASATVAILIIIGLLTVACDIEDPDLVSSRETQSSVMDRATAAVPPYEPDQFPLRESINWYLQQTEQADLWYVYMLNLNGEPIFYIVSDILPLSVCRSITSPDRIADRHGDDFVISAPSLTGTYGSAGECGDYFTRDATTGAMIRFTPGAASWIASTVPLNLDTDQLRAR